MAKLRLLIRVSSNTWGPLLLTDHIDGLSGYPWQNSGSTPTSTLVWSWHHLKHSMVLPFPPCKVTFLALLELMPWIFFCAKGILFWLLSRHTLLLHRRGRSFKQTSTVKTCPFMWEIGFTWGYNPISGILWLIKGSGNCPQGFLDPFRFCRKWKLYPIS